MCLGWGLPGARDLAATAPGRVSFVVVDVLSFTTAVSVACDRGIEVFPSPWPDDERVPAPQPPPGAALAGPRGSGLSLSPAELRTTRGLSRLVLPSPNGAAISSAMSGRRVIAGCLRNATAVAQQLAARLGAVEETVVVIAAGELRVDGSLRHAEEDLWGAGAVIGNLLEATQADATPEAVTAARAFGSVRDALDARLISCESGRELVAAGWALDVRIAAELDSTSVVPELVGGRFVARSPGIARKCARR